MHSSGNAEGAEPGAADIERRVQRGEIRRKAGERKPEREKMPKKESSGGKERRDEERAFERWKGGPCAGNCHLRPSRNQRVTNPDPVVSARPHGKSLAPPLTSPRERSLISLPQLVATNQRVG